MKTIKQEYIINAPLENVWNALVVSSEIEKWGAGPALMVAKTGSKFSLWGGEIFGTNTKVIENKILEQDWYAGKWEKPSKVHIELTYKDKKTKVALLQTDMPDAEVDNLADGWRDYYMERMKEYLEKVN